MTTGPIHYRYTRHALDVLVERQLQASWVERAIQQPEWTETDPSDPAKTRAFGRVPERDGRILRVVYVGSGSSIRVITAFLDRRKAGRP